MKKLFTIVIFTLLTLNSFSQNKNYRIENKKVNIVKAQSEYVILEIDEGDQHSNYKGFKSLAFNGATLLSFAIDQIPKIPEYFSKIIKGQKKKYIATYSAKNTIDFDSKANLPIVTLTRYINNPSENKACEIILESKKTINESFAFYIKNVSIKYSKAKIKKGYTHLNLVIEISVTYDTTSKKDETLEVNKTEVKSSTLKIPVSMTTGTAFNSNMMSQLSDAFPIDNILEISVKVTETNPYKVKLEDIESVVEDFKEPIADFFKKLGESLEK